MFERAGFLLLWLLVLLAAVCGCQRLSLAPESEDTELAWSPLTADLQDDEASLQSVAGDDDDDDGVSAASYEPTPAEPLRGAVAVVASDDGIRSARGYVTGQTRPPRT